MLVAMLELPNSAQC